MGRHESLTAWALGRGAYERDVIQTQVPAGGHSNQQYNERGHPRNSESKRKERALVHAANEVMQVTGLVEDARAARADEKAFNEQRLEDTFTGLRYMEIGRPLLVAGTWGAMGLRRRILLYKPYSSMGLLDIIQHEASVRSVPRILLSGIPTLLVYQISDYACFIVQICIDSIFEELRAENGNRLTSWEVRVKKILTTSTDIGFYYMTLHLRLFSILQQLNLVPQSRLFPSFSSFFPFTEASPIHLPAQPSLTRGSMGSWTLEVIRIASPVLIIWSVGRIKHFVSRLLYRPIYKSLPRPIGESMFSGTENLASVFDDSGVVDHIENPVPASGDAVIATSAPNRSESEDELTLRALEGNQSAGQEGFETEETEASQRVVDRVEADDTASDEGGDAAPVATLISFDVEATEQVDHSRGHWSAELRSAHEPKPSNTITYRVTGMTLLPTILATEVLREIVAGVLVMPLEAVMVRVIGRAYQHSAGLDLSNIYSVNDFWSLLPAAENLFGAIALQVVFAGVCWAGYTYAAQKYEKRKKVMLEDTKQQSPIG